MRIEWPENERATPVMGVEGGWIRPGELLVPLKDEAQLEQHLVRHGGQRYEPGVIPEPIDWRRQRSEPDDPDVNARLVDHGLRLWAGFPAEHPAEMVKDPRLPGLHLNHVFIGEATNDFYHGGPDGPPVAVAGPKSGEITTSETESDGIEDIAVLDTGLPAGWFETHPNMELMLRRFQQLFPDDPLDENGDGLLDEQGGHGPFICGLIARVAPELDIQLRRALRATGEGDEAKLIPVLGELVASQARVVNLSLGGHTVNGQEPACAETVRNLVRKGKVVVAAAGNDGHLPDLADRPFYPACLPEVIAVGAYELKDGTPTLWSKSHEAQIYTLGVHVLSSFVSGWPDPATGGQFNGWAKWSGTSFATPLVAARIAQLMLEHDTSDTDEILDIWRRTGELHEEPDWPRKPMITGPALRYDPKKNVTRWD